MENNPRKNKSFNADEREQIIFHRQYDPENYKDGGICKFKSLHYNVIRELMDKGYLDPDDFQNCSPTVDSFATFVKNHDPENWYFFGYVVSPKRDDCRVAIEGIGSYKPLSMDDLIDFLQEYRHADEIDAERDEPVYCWYD